MSACSFQYLRVVVASAVRTRQHPRTDVGSVRNLCVRTVSGRVAHVRAASVSSVLL